MIVKNEENILKRTLPVLSANVDELIVVDTGSTDGTIETAKGFKASVFSFPWVNDFAAARNESIKHATSEWVIWIDADETMKAEDIQKLKIALKGIKEDGAVLPLYECREGEYQATTFYFRLKVFRNGIGAHFIRPVNEELVGSDGKQFPGRIMSDIPIFHWGGSIAISSEKFKQKKDRNISLFRENIKKSPDDAYFHYLLANNLREVGEMKEAADEYLKAADLLKSGALASNSMAKRAAVLFSLNDNDGAYSAAKSSAQMDPRNAEAYNLIGSIYLAVNNLDKAIEVLSYSSGLPVPQVIEVSIDLNQYTYLPNYLLGNAYLLKGDKVNALHALERAYSFNANDDLKKTIEKLKSS